MIKTVKSLIWIFTEFFVIRIPNGTSPELTNLLCGLLKRDARDRLDFDTFFNHTFIRPPPPIAPPQPPVTKPVNVPSSAPVSNSSTPKNSVPTSVPGALPPSPVVAMSKLLLLSVLFSFLLYALTWTQAKALLECWYVVL